MKRTWEPSTGPDRYRRGLYTFFWRATPYPALTVFDAPDAVQACTRRIRSNTPLQALTLLNDQAFVEFAAGPGRPRAGAKAPPTTRSGSDHAFRLCLGREPSRRGSPASARRRARPGAGRAAQRLARAATRSQAGLDRPWRASCSTSTSSLPGSDERRVNARESVMNPHDRDLAGPTCCATQTRRHFFGRLRRRPRLDGPGRRCCGEGRAATAGRAAGSRQANPLAPGRGTSRRRPRTSSTCSWRAGRASSSCSTTSRSCSEFNGQPIPRVVHQGAAVRVHGHVHQGRAEAPRHAPQVRPARRVGAWVSRAAAAPRRDRGRRRYRPHGGDRRVQPRPGEVFVNTGTPQFGRPSMGAWVTYGIGSESRQPARLRRAAIGPARPARRRGQLGERLPADASIRACPSAAGGEPILDLATPPGDHSGPAAPGRSTRSAT